MKHLLLLSTLIFIGCVSNSEPMLVDELEDEAILSQTLIEQSQNFQLSYINNDFEGANAFMSTDFETTVFNSNGTDLIVQTQDNIENSGDGWDFDEFIMSNHSVTFDADQSTAVVVFNTDGSISFEGGEQNIPYSTRASQTWVRTSMGWKIMHSHWSPRIGALGVPVEE